MNYKKIEELFVDFILDIVGPNTERENERNINFSIIKNIIINKFNINFPDYNIYILPYGSFPTKTYLKNADIDITIFFEEKSSQKILIDIPLELINKTFMTIKNSLEKYNKESSFELFSDIKIILADIRLLKCKMGSISLDISVNNFSGMYKILFIDYIEDELKTQFNKHNLFYDSSYSSNKINIFRRSLLLIKSWCFYEGNLMGSNIGLMANYTLEILVIYIFNLHYEYIYNEFDIFEKFFDFLENNLEKNVISIYGIISNLNFHQKLSVFNSDVLKDENVNQPFWFLNEKYKNINENNEINENKINVQNNIKQSEPLLNLDKIKNFIIHINKNAGNIFLKKEGKVINATNYDKLVNILDPLNNHNNLGKSINFHSYSKMKKVIVYINKKLKKIQIIRKKVNPFLYINSLLNLFKITLSNNFIHLFINSISTPKIISNSKLLKHTTKYKNINTDKKKFKIDKNDINKFNILFSSNKITIDENIILENEDYDDFVEEIENDEFFEKSEPEEEDEYAEEDDEDENGKNIKKKEIENDNNINIENENEEKIVFPIIINNEIIKKLFELYENKQKNVKYNNLLLKESREYSNNLEKFLKEHNLLS